MATKASTVVVIDKKEYNLSGFEEEEYLQRVAAYINQKITEMNQQDSYKRIPQDMKNIMLQLNLADDYFKAKEQAGNAGSKFSDLEKEIFDLKHQLVDAQMQLDEANGKISEANSKLELVKKQNEQLQGQIEELEKEKRELTQKNERLTADLEEVLLK
ncbi:MAG: cell division protein ZapA [Lachnospiraceae bacterium]|nr:cell division protein ZapA [Lachnospiraceae bacterium]